jgi:hypothetical protein
VNVAAETIGGFLRDPVEWAKNHDGAGDDCHGDDDTENGGFAFGHDWRPFRMPNSGCA